MRGFIIWKILSRHDRIARFPRGFWPFVQGTSLLLDSEIILSTIYTQVAM